MEGVDGWLARVEFDFDGHQVEEGLLAVVVPTAKPGRFGVAEQLLTAAQRVEVGRVVRRTDVLAEPVAPVADQLLALLSGRDLVQW